MVGASRRNPPRATRLASFEPTKSSGESKFVPMKWFRSTRYSSESH